MCGGSNKEDKPQAAAAPTLPADVQSVLNTLYMSPTQAVNPSGANASAPQIAIDQQKAQKLGPSGYSADMKKNLGMADTPPMGYGGPNPQPSGMVNLLDKPEENADFIKLFSR